MDIGGVNANYLQYLNEMGSTQSSKQVEKSLQGDYTNATDDELMKVCKEFEAYFLEQVFKEMMKTIPESESLDNGNAQLVDFFKDNVVQELAAQSTEQNSLGLAQTMYEQMKRNISPVILDA